MHSRWSLAVASSFRFEFMFGLPVSFFGVQPPVTMTTSQWLDWQLTASQHTVWCRYNSYNGTGLYIHFSQTYQYCIKIHWHKSIYSLILWIMNFSSKKTLFKMSAKCNEFCSVFNVLRRIPLLSTHLSHGNVTGSPSSPSFNVALSRYQPVPSPSGS